MPSIAEPAFGSLRTERLVIDRLVAADEMAIVAYKNDPSVAQFQCWPLPYTADNARRLVSHTVGINEALVGGGQLAIRAARSDELMGDLMVEPVPGTTHAFELGITVGLPWQGMGYANEALRAVIDALFADGRAHKLVAYVDVANAPSLRLFDRQGFHREGLLRSSYQPRNGGLVDEVLFGLTRHEWSRPQSEYDVIAFDADDTLWKSENSFAAAEAAFVELVTPYVQDGVDVKAALTAVERKNLHVFGYGVRAFGLSMVETATSLAAAEAIPRTVIGQLVEMTRSMLAEPVQLLADVPSVLEQVGANHRLVLITKGDLIHQSNKIEASGLAHHFEVVEIVLEKDAAAYARIITALGVPPHRFCMVGNSVRSDILPVLSIGASAVHVPYHLLWDLEQTPSDHGHTFAELARLADLPAWLRESTTVPAE